MDELARALAVVGRKWALLIVEALREGPRRFTEIERSLGAANPRMVTARLPELEAAAVGSRTGYRESLSYEIPIKPLERRGASRVSGVAKFGGQRGNRTPTAKGG